MKIKNYQLSSMIELIRDLKLKGKLSRKRTNLLHLLVDAYQEVVLAEQKLKEDFAIRDELGDIIYKDTERTVFEVSLEYKDEYDILANECFVIEESEYNKDMIITVGEVLLEGEFEVSGATATYYDEWCNEFEEALERYRDK